jgi:predicted Kef-type K+ transport protein
MNAKHRILLELSTILFILFYYFSFYCYSVLYLFGGLYYPINESIIKTFLPFEIFVISICALILFLIIHKFNSKSFLALLLQNILIVIFTFPFISVSLDFIANHILNTDKEYYMLSLSITLIVCLIMIQYNNYQKLKHKKASC